MNFKDFFVKEKWKNMKKSDWLILALVGVLILIIAIPVTDPDETKEKEGTAEIENTEENTLTTADYRKQLEEELEGILGRMQGVGKVSVMITLADEGEKVVEKDIEQSETSGDEKSSETQKKETSVYVEGDTTTPYVSKEIRPKVEGVLVVAQGADAALVRQNISNAALALFSVEAHKIVVVEMNE